MKKVGLRMYGVIAVVLCLMIATVGTATAKQDQKTSQAGNSSIYFYDVEPSDMHGKGKLEIDVDKHTFVFNGQGFEPSQLIILKAMAANSNEYVVFGIGKATPSGNLHIAGTWDVAVDPATVLAGYPLDIVGFWVNNEGWFTVRVACYFSTDDGVTWTESGSSEKIYGLGDDLIVQLDSLTGPSVPVGALVKLHVVVIGGNDKTGSVIFRFGNDNKVYAFYDISGTTLNAQLDFINTITWN